MIKQSKTKVSLAADEYDRIASKYQDATRREFRMFTLEPTLKRHLGSLSGKIVLDLACGSGYSSRLSRDLGAKEVVGIDVSSKEIKLARELEGAAENEIKYLVGDAAGDLSHLGTFDVVTSIMLLHYSTTKSMIDKMVKNAKEHLSSGGVFIAATVNPKLVFDYDGYGVRMKSETKEEGSPFTTTLCDFEGNEFCHFTNYYWKKETYQEIFEKNGFEVEWLDSLISEEGIAKYGEAFWKELKANPIYLILRAEIKS